MDDNYLIIDAMARDRLGDLSQFDGHTKGPWNNEYDFPLMGNRDIHATEWSHEPNRRLALPAPDLLTEVRELRRENEELRERIGKALERLRYNASVGTKSI